MDNKVKIFISYAHADNKYLKDIKQYLNKETLPGIDLWDDISIDAGEEFDPKIKQQLNEANIILLLISQNFFQSTYISSIELKTAFEKYDRKECIILPIFVRTCVFTKEIEKRISAIQGYPSYNEKRRRFLSEMEEDVYTHLTEIHKGVLAAAEKIKVTLNKPLIEQNKKDVLELKNNNKICLALPISDVGAQMVDKLNANITARQSSGEKWDFEVVNIKDHIGPLWKSNSELPNFAADMIAQSIYSIHIITSLEEINHHIFEEQFSQATTRNRSKPFAKSIVWLRSDEIRDGLEPDVLRNSIVSGSDIEKIFDLISQFEIKRKKILREMQERFQPVNLETLMIFDLESDDNNEFRKVVKKEIDGRKVCSVRINNPNSTLPELKEKLMECKGAIIVYGAVQNNWYYARQDILIDARSLKAKGVIVTGPDIQEKIDGAVSVQEFSVIREDAGDDNLQSEVDIFLYKLRA